MNEMVGLYCDVCGTYLLDEEGNRVCGFSMALPGTKHPEVERFKKMFGQTTVTICLCCFAKGFGMPAISNGTDEIDPRSFN